MTIVQRIDGTQYALDLLGIYTIEFLVSSPYYENDLVTIEKASGIKDLGTTIGYRNISCSFLMESTTVENFQNHRNEVFKIFDSREAFYLIDKDEPDRRWLVKVSGKFDIPQIRRFGRFEINFIGIKGYAESNELTAETYTSTTFLINNASDIRIDPREHQLVISYQGPSTNLSITNITTNEEWTYNGTSVDGDVVEINGIRSLKNGISILKNSNKKLITLAPGINNFTLTGTSGSFEITFEFRFLYL